jgi:hypothetical protein
MASAPADEAQRYRDFVERSLSELRCGLGLDNGHKESKKGRIAAAFAARKGLKLKRNAAQLVLEGRFLLGADDTAYLASGLGLLWSTVGNKECAEGAAELELAPATLYMPEATNGIRKGLIKALEASHANHTKDDQCDQLNTFLRALAPLLAVDAIGEKVDKGGTFREAITRFVERKCSGVDEPSAQNDLKAIARGLLLLRKELQDAQGGHSLATSILNEQRKQVGEVNRQRKVEAAAAKVAKRELNVAKDDRDKAVAAEATAQAEREGHKKARVAAEQKVVELTAQLAARESELLAKTQALNEATAKLEAMERQYQAAVDEFKAITEEVKKLSAEAAAAKALVGEECAASVAAARFAANVRAAVKAKEAKAEAVAQMLGAVAEEKAAWEQKLAVVEQDRRSEANLAEKRYERLVKRKDELIAKAQTQGGQITELLVAQEQLTADTVAAKQDLLAETQKLEECERAKAKAKAETAVAEAEADRVRGGLLVIREELKTKTAEAEEAQRKSEEAQRKSEEAQRKLDEARETVDARVAEAQAAQTKAEQERDECLAQTEALQKAKDAAEADMEDYRQQLAVLRAQSITGRLATNKEVTRNKGAVERAVKARRKALELKQGDRIDPFVSEEQREAVGQLAALKERLLGTTPTTHEEVLAFRDEITKLVDAAGVDDYLREELGAILEDKRKAMDAVVEEEVIKELASDSGMSEDEAGAAVETIKSKAVELMKKGITDKDSYLRTMWGIVREQVPEALKDLKAQAKADAPGILLAAVLGGAVSYWGNVTGLDATGDGGATGTDGDAWYETFFAAAERSAASAAGKASTSTTTTYDHHPDVATAVLRGLVGQRGPTEPARIGSCPQDALLPYTLPSARALAKVADTVEHVLAHTPAPTEAGVARAVCACRALCAATPAEAEEGEDGGHKRPRLAPPSAELDGESLVTEAESLAALEGNFAITGVEPAHADDARRGVELPHEVRWMPRGPRAVTMARVAVLEHAVARCTHVAGLADTPAPVARALRGAAAALKLQQLEPLYALKEAVAFEDEPHPLGTETPLVTRPCAVVRGVLSFPTDAGVAPRPAQVATGGPSTDLTRLEQAMGKTAAETSTLRNRLRRERAAMHFYVAPPAHALAFREVPTDSYLADLETLDSSAPGAPAPGAPTEAEQVDERIGALFQSVERLALTTNRALVLVAGLSPGNLDAVGAFLNAEELEGNNAGAVTVQTRRDGLWTEFQRHLAIAQDRLWIFVRLMSGCIGGDVSEVITMADEATLAATKAVQQQRADISKRVSDMQTKIVETVVGSMLKSSGLALDLGQDQLTVIDTEAKKKLQDLAAGTSGRPFFEANVAMRNLTENDKAAPMPLSKVLEGLATAGTQMQATLEATLQEPGMGAASLAELSHPTNSYFVSMRPDATAAIREAHEKLNVELTLNGGARRLTLWELVEGGCAVLTNRFADFCGFLLVQKRSSTGVSAMYVSHLSIRTNASQARISLARLVGAACAYAARVPPPRFLEDAANTEQARWDALTAAEAVEDADVVQRPVTLVRNVLAAPVHPSGWSVVGGRVR